MLANEQEAAEILKSSYFRGTERCVKRRVRGFLSSVGIEPVEKTEDAWLYLIQDVEDFFKWRSKLPNAKARPTTKSRGRSGESAFDKARELAH